MSKKTRREFLEQSLFTAAAAALAGSSRPVFADDSEKQSTSPNERLRVGVVGVNSRGQSHLGGLGGRTDCEIAAIIDIDEAVGRTQVEAVQKRTKKTPKFYRDIRKMLEDDSIDIVTVATPNHWHSLAAIWAIQSGKHVYVEKPVSHNVSEGRRVVQAARKHKKIVQTGTQCRSNPGMREAMEFIRSGKIGDIKVARGLCYKRRQSIGAKGIYEVPKSVDYDLWSGPAPIKPLTRPRFHYDWHWQWEYGNGDLGNQGIHQMDLARWGLGVDDIGTSVVSYGGRLGYEDAGETANTQVSIHEYPGGKRLVFEVRGLPTDSLRGATVGVIFNGAEEDSVVTGYGDAAAFDLKGNLIQKFTGGNDRYHYENFLSAVRSGRHEDLNADILEGHLSSALCHLGNVSYQLGEQATGNAAAERLAGDAEAVETFDRFKEHLAANSVAISDKPVVRFGKRLSIDPQAEVFTGEGASQANPMLTRDYRAPFVVPSEENV